MTADRQQSDKANPSARVIMPPYLVLRDFLEDETAAGLLEYACAHEAAFAPTRTGHFAEAEIDPDMRVSVGTRDLGPFRRILETKVLGLLPDLIAQLRMTPVEAATLELQLVAHNDGAFYKHQTCAFRQHPHFKRRLLFSCPAQGIFGRGAAALRHRGSRRDNVCRHRAGAQFAAGVPVLGAA